MDKQFFHFIISFMSFMSFTIIIFHFNVSHITGEQMGIEAWILDKLFHIKYLVLALEIHFQRVLVNFS